jgi:hypothetical protein
VVTAFYKKFVLVSSAVAVICFIIYCIIDANFTDYKSDFITSDAFYPLGFAVVIANALLIAFLSLTILLNHYEFVKNNTLLNALTWFLFPMAWIGLILIKTNWNLAAFSKGIDNPAIFVLINTLPYIATSILLFTPFSRSLKATEGTQNK